MNEEKITFDKTKELRIIVNDIFTEIDTKLKILTNLYKDLVKTHVDKNYRLGIDSFHFQNKLMQMEYDNMKNISGFIDNRIYCEYYKLLKMLYIFIKNEIKDKTIIDKLLIMHKQYPIYKDLEPSKLYEFDITTEINNTIVNIIKELKLFLNSEKEELSNKQKQSDMGINIDSMVHEQQYNIILLEERINMFENYLTTFGNHHSKYFSRIIIKLKLILGIVNEDFHLQNTRSLQLKKKPSKNNKNNNSNKNTINDIETNHIDHDSISNTSTNSSNTPIASMNDQEEENVRFLIGNMSNRIEIENELNTILQHIPQGDNENCATRNTIKKKNSSVEI